MLTAAVLVNAVVEFGAGLVGWLRLTPVLDNAIAPNCGAGTDAVMKTWGCAAMSLGAVCFASMCHGDKAKQCALKGMMVYHVALGATAFMAYNNDNSSSDALHTAISHVILGAITAAGLRGEGGCCGGCCGGNKQKGQ